MKTSFGKQQDAGIEQVLGVGTVITILIMVAQDKSSVW